MADAPTIVPQIPPTSVSPIAGSGPLTLPWRKFFQYLSTIQAGSITPEQIAALTTLANEALAAAEAAQATANEALAAKATESILPLLALGGDGPTPALSFLNFLTIGSLDVVGGISQLTGDVTAGPGSGVQAAILAAAQPGAHTWAAAQTFTAGATVGTTTLLASNVALTNGAGAGLGTLTNAPAAGNPTKWIPINDNGTTRYIPAW